MVTPLSPRLALALLITALAVGCKKKPATDDAPAPDTPPPGARPGMPTPGGPGTPGTPPKGDDAAAWSEIKDTVGGFRVSVPGFNHALNMTNAPDEKKKRQMVMFQNDGGPNRNRPLVTTYSFVPLPPTKIGSSPDDLYAGLLAHRDGVMTFHDVLTKESIKLGGKPGLRVMTKANNFRPPLKSDDPEHAARLEEGYKRDIARRWTYLVSNTATRVIVVMVQSEGDPNPADLKTIIDSFAFL